MENTYEIQTDIGIREAWPPISSTGTTAGKAKYNAYLERREYFNGFIDFLRSVISCNKVPACIPERRPELFPGDLVRMTGCPEAQRYEDKVFTVRTEPQLLCGSWCVWLEGYPGGFSCGCLKKIVSKSE